MLRLASIGSLGLMLALVGCESDDLHQSACDLPCYDGPVIEAGVGICRAGRAACTNGIVTECEGDVGPQEETCNGVDDDCNGVPDDNLVRTCQSVVGAGTETCENGQWVRCTAPMPRQEICNGFDDDYNGVIDDGVPVGNPCYTGDLEDLRWARTACHAGVELCDHGLMTCLNQVRPVAEFCGNGLDDDCDGLIDEADGGTQDKDVDIVLVVDRSCSMGNKLANVVLTLQEFLLAHPSPQYMYSFVDVPGINTSKPVVTYDFIDHVQASSVAATLDDMTFGGIEASYDAFAEIGYGTLKPLSWRQGSFRIVFWFGDEDGQTNANWTESTAARALAQANILFFGFVLVSWAQDYNDIAIATGGQIFDLLLSRTEMHRIFFETVIPTCIEGP